MKNSFATIFLLLTFCSNGLADSYYFKDCNISEEYIGNYLIDINNKLINVTFIKKNDESAQTWADKIEKVKNDQIISKKIPSKTGKDYYFQYYLNAKSKSITRQKYKKENDFYQLDGPVIESRCGNVKADWNIIEEKTGIEKNLEIEKKKKELEKKRRKEELESKERKKKKIEKEKSEKKYNISIDSKKWIKLSKYGPDSEKKLKKNFDQKAAELCSLTGNFKIIKKRVEIIEMDETPAFGLETVIKLGIKGIIECK